MCLILVEVVIQMAGRVQVTGSVEGLIARFCEYLSITIRTENQQIFDLLKAEHAGIELHDQNDQEYIFKVPLVDQEMASTMGKLFQIMESKKIEWKVIQYSVAQMTLNNVFLELARNPIHPPRNAAGDKVPWNSKRAAEHKEVGNNS